MVTAPVFISALAGAGTCVRRRHLYLCIDRYISLYIFVYRYISLYICVCIYR